MKNKLQKLLISVCFILLIIGHSFAQSDDSAIMNIASTEKGILIPRMTTTQRTNINSPAKGLLVFDNMTNSFWFYNGSDWSEIGGGAGVQGPAGPKGDTGAQGPIGPKGDTGAQGLAGPKGDTGAQGLKGDTGATGLAGPKGDTGAQGIAGPKGDTGAQGPTGDSFWSQDGNKISYTASNGKVVIGENASVATPGDDNLYVEDGILAERMRVALTSSDNWADDAFGKKPSLKRMEKHIQKKSHLMGVPSAADLVKNGIDMAEMDATLLRQIEWLWEYAIESEKERKKLEKENQRLKKQFDLFNKRLMSLEVAKSKK